MHDTPDLWDHGEGKNAKGPHQGFTAPLSLARLLPKSSLCSVPSSWPISSSLSPSLSLRDDWLPASHLNSGVQWQAGCVHVCRWERRDKRLSLAQQRKAQSQAGLWRPSLGRKSSESWGYLSRGLNEVRIDSHTDIWDEDILGTRNSKHKGLAPGRP